MALHNSLTGYEPKQLDNFDYSETDTAIFQDESGDTDTEPSYLSLSEKCYLHNCSLRSEKNQRTCDKLITLMKKVCCQLSPFHTYKYGETRVRTKFRFVSKKTEIRSRPGKRANQDSP